MDADETTRSKQQTGALIGRLLREETQRAHDRALRVDPSAPGGIMPVYTHLLLALMGAAEAAEQMVDADAFYAENPMPDAMVAMSDAYVRGREAVARLRDLGLIGDES